MEDNIKKKEDEGEDRVSCQKNYSGEEIFSSSRKHISLGIKCAIIIIARRLETRRERKNMYMQCVHGL